MKKSIFIYSDALKQYHYPADCPFKAERATRTKEILQSLSYYAGENRTEVAPVPASPEELLLFHTPQYLEILRQVSSGRFDPAYRFNGLGTQDCPVFPDLYEYGVLAAGGSITGAKLIVDKKADYVFNPSGGYHHASADKAGGFCYINDVVLACMTLRNAGKKVLCLDFDAHHGNGTQSAFYGSDDIFTVSFHESGKNLYPWSGFENELGEKEGFGYNLNMPFPPGTDDETYFSVFNSIIPPIIKTYNPDVIVVEIGMDILSIDPLTHLRMTNNVIADMLPQIMQFDKPMLVVGGGGYSPEDTARGWALCWTILCSIVMEEDMYMGLGGVFLGSAEWNAGLRDKHIYIHGKEKESISNEVEQSMQRLQNLFRPYITF